MTQQIQHRMSNPASPWVALGLLTVGGVVAYYFWMENEKKKKEGEVETREPQVLPPSAWSVDPNVPPAPVEVEAGQLYKAVFTTPLTAPQDGEIPMYEIAYLPEGALNVLEVTQQILQDEVNGLGAEVTITFIPQVVPETQGDASIIASTDHVFRGLSLSIQE